MYNLAMRNLLLPLLFAAALSAQDRLINLRVVALDRNNQPVANLSADDFEIQEQGKPVPIALFRSVDPKIEEEPLGARELSNRGGPPIASATVLLYDMMQPIDARLARAQVTKALANASPTDPVYFYILVGKGLMSVRGLPEAGKETQKTGPLSPADVDAAFDRAMKANVDHLGLGIGRIELTYQALMSLASRLGGMPGRKNIIWISRGVPTSIESPQPGDSRDYIPYQTRLTAAMQRGNVAMYPVGDARNEIGSGGMSMMNEMAARTGGSSSAMDVGATLQHALQDSRASYTLAFSPRVWDSKYHKIRVGCTKAGVRVLAPDGYYPGLPANIDDEQTIVGGAELSPFDSAEIGIRASVGPSPKVMGAARLSVRVQTADLQLLQTDAGFSGDVVVTLVAYDDAGKPAVLRQNAYPFKMTADQHRDALQHGTKLSPDVTLKDEIRKVRVIVYDRNSNAVGSITLPITPADRSAVK